MSSAERNNGGFNGWWWAAASLLVLLLVAGGITLGVSLAQGGDEPEGASSSSAKPGPSSSQGAPDSVQSPATETGCAADAYDGTIPVQGPAARWETVGYFFYPTSERYGPGAIPAGNTWGCFEHSPTGALFAAANVLATLFSDDYKTRMSDAAVENPALAAVLQEDPSLFTTSANTAQLNGFQFVSTSESASAVSLGFVSGELSGEMTVHLVWDEVVNNWKVDFSKTDPFEMTTYLPDTYTSWSAVDEPVG